MCIRDSFRDSASKHINQLVDGFDQYIEHNINGAPVNLKVDGVQPKSPGILGAMRESFNNKNAFGSSTGPDQSPAITFNKNADRAYASHELGHIASQQTDAGRLVATLRANPALSGALGAALLGVPFVASAIEDGDDDMDTAIAGAALMHAPTLMDEVAATYHGNRITDKAGLRTSLGQHGKMAGGLLSYMAAPILLGGVGNILGNQFDEDV